MRKLPTCRTVLPALSFGIVACAAARLAHAAEEAADAAPAYVATVGSQPRGFAQRALGARAFFAERVADDGAGGGAIYERSIAALYSDWISARYFDELWFGHDAEDFTYSISGQLAMGVWWNFNEHSGPFARAAIRGDFRRQGGVFFSALRVPEGQVGWSYVRGSALFEAFAHVGTTLVGRFESRRAGYDLGGFTWGAAGAWSWDRVRFDLDVSRVGQASAGGAVWDARSHLCMYWGKASLTAGSRGADDAAKPAGSPEPAALRGAATASFSFATCADGSILSGQIPSLNIDTLSSPHSALTQLTQGVIGFSVVFGAFHLLDPVPNQ